MKKNLSTNIFLLKLKRIYDGSESDNTGDPDNLSYIIEAIHQLDANLILDGLLNSGERKENVNKRKVCGFVKLFLSLFIFLIVFFFFFFFHFFCNFCIFHLCNLNHKVSYCLKCFYQVC